METKESDIKEKAHDSCRLEMELKSAQAAISRAQKAMQDLAERGSTRYSSLLRTQASGYRDLLNALLADSQALGEYSGGYLVRPGKGGQALYVGEADSGVKRGGSTPLSQDDGYIVEVTPPAGSR